MNKYAGITEDKKTAFRGRLKQLAAFHGSWDTIEGAWPQLVASFSRLRQVAAT